LSGRFLPENYPFTFVKHSEVREARCRAERDLVTMRINDNLLTNVACSESAPLHGHKNNEKSHYFRKLARLVYGARLIANLDCESVASKSRV